MEGPIEIRVTDVPIVRSNARVKGTNSLVFSQFWNWTPFYLKNSPFKCVFVNYLMIICPHF
jgi:hypothetical protein